jgi:flavin reductase (DIM6/NTAB) family NADH-FMN oxidoreductase RutF
MGHCDFHGGGLQWLGSMRWRWPARSLAVRSRAPEAAAPAATSAAYAQKTETASAASAPGIRTGIGPTAFRNVMSRFPNGVSVITTLDQDDCPCGFTCTSLCSVSLRPPLLLTCVHNSSRTLAAARARGSFAVNLLHVGGRAAAELFASDVTNKFAHVTWRPGPTLGLPWLTDFTAALLECSVEQDVVAGDHSVLVGLVTSADPAGRQAPLIYLRRSYGTWPLDDANDGEIIMARSSREKPRWKADGSG